VPYLLSNRVACRVSAPAHRQHWRAFVCVLSTEKLPERALLVPGAAVHTLAVVKPDLPSNTKSTRVLCGMSAVDTDAPAAGTIIWPYDVKERTY